MYIKNFTGKVHYMATQEFIKCNACKAVCFKLNVCNQHKAVLIIKSAIKHIFLEEPIIMQIFM